MRPISKILNPLVNKVAGRRHMSMAAAVFHTGRRTGRTYTTSTGARLAGNVFVIPLTFGTQSDWCRNLIAAGGGQIRLQARTYEVRSPLLFAWKADPALVKAAFPGAMRTMLKVLGIKAFIRLDIVQTQLSPDMPHHNAWKNRSRSGHSL
jgi:hypothetical protein